MNILSAVGFIATVTGIAGMAGAIHFGTGYVQSAALMVGGGFVLYITEKIEKGRCRSVCTIRGSRPHPRDGRMEGQAGEGEPSNVEGGNDRYQQREKEGKRLWEVDNVLIVELIWIRMRNAAAGIRNLKAQK